MEIPTVNELESQLFKAIRDGNLQEVQGLIQKGVNLNFKNRKGNMPLHLATACGQESILEALLAFQLLFPLTKIKISGVSVEVASVTPDLHPDISDKRELKTGRRRRRNGAPAPPSLKINTSSPHSELSRVTSLRSSRPKVEFNDNNMNLHNI